MAYAIVNRWESVAGIDLDTGEQVFRADFSAGDMRVKATFAMDISPDGKELFVFRSPVRLGLDAYEAQDTYIAVYNTADGIGAAPDAGIVNAQVFGSALSTTPAAVAAGLDWLVG